MSMGEEQLRVIIEDDDAGTAKSMDEKLPSPNVEPRRNWPRRHAPELRCSVCV